ncbi:protein-arginine kinase activator protein McsA [Salinibacillus aidingensis]|uniref:Protein-arginine kinase activator protein McsA n=1 Tax=Salinibacillus aidingensis TaxID=237684 RepID=A0ABN1BQS7_9BACI
MKCQECEKRPATVHFSQVVNGEKTEVHLCEYCAQEKGYMDQYNQNFSFQDLLSGLFNFDSGTSFKESQGSSFQSNHSLQCDKCGMTYEEFKRRGKFGCDQCYETFDQHLNPIFRRVHSGNTTHDGKIPKRVGGNLHLKRNLQQYRLELQKLIEKEQFEEAAKMRDQIRELEKQLNNDKGGEV